MARLSTRELDRLLRRHGCELRTLGAKHEKWFSPVTGKVFMVPRTLKTDGVLTGILSDAGIPDPTVPLKKKPKNFEP